MLKDNLPDEVEHRGLLHIIDVRDHEHLTLRSGEFRKDTHPADAKRSHLATSTRFTAP